MPKQWKIDALLIEKAASGIELMQALEGLPDREVPTAIPQPTTTGKESRMWGQLARFEAGDVRLPADAPWLGTFLHELLGFPKTRHDDQADALVHLLIWSLDAGWDTPQNSGPMIHNPETGRWEGGDFGDVHGDRYKSRARQKLDGSVALACW